MSEVYIITGPPGVGKSTVSKILAKKKSKSALIEGDSIYYLVTSGIKKPWELGNHLKVFWENIIDLMDNFNSNDYDVVFNYICTPEDIERIRHKLDKVDIYFCILVAKEDVVMWRDSMREPENQMGKRAILLSREFNNFKYDKKFYLDTSNLTPEETVDEVLKNKNFLLKSRDI